MACVFQTLCEIANLGFLMITKASFKLTVSAMKKTLSILLMSLWAAAGLASTAVLEAAMSSAKQVGTGPAMISPSNLDEASCQELILIVGTLSLQIVIG